MGIGGILGIAAGLLLAAAIGWKIFLSTRYRGMQYNWFSFKKEGFAFGLNKPEILLLRDIAYAGRASNFNALYTSMRALDGCILRNIETIKNTRLSEEDKHTRIENIFLLRNRIDNIIASRKQSIDSTMKLKPTQLLVLTFERVGSYPSQVLDNNPNHFAVEIPPNTLNMEEFSWKGKKVQVRFSISNDAEYNLVSRVLDQATTASTGLLHIAHSNRMIRTQKRIYRRNPSSIPVSIFTLKLASEGTNRKITVANPTPFSGTIVNISAGGVAIRVGGFLKENTLVKLDFSLDFEATDIAVGRVLSFTPIPASAEKMLHVKFERISKKTRNRIFEYIYRDEKPATPAGLTGIGGGVAVVSEG
jgi:c-di-GMP-binding flagellar brake protein YcgR